jgi:type IV fimbrial biogenesis protein FimT
MRRTNFQHASAGVTLIEMLIGVAVVGVVLAVAIPSLTSLIERRRVVAAAGEIASFFAQARAESAVTADKISLHLEPVPADVGDFSCIRMSSHATADTCRCNRAATKLCSVGYGRLLREYLLPRSSSVRFDVNENATWGPVDNHMVTFSRGAFPTEVSNVFVRVKGERTGALLHVDFNHAGRVRICTPDGSIGGFPSCG